MSTLDEIAPYPQQTEDVTADALIAHYAAFGEMQAILGYDLPGGPQWRESIAQVFHSFSVVYLLREIRSRLPQDVADHIARGLWGWWADGNLPTELWSWVSEAGLSHEAIETIAAGIAEKNHTEAAPAEQKSGSS